MNLNIQTVVALCAGAGFLIVWIAVPSKKAKAAAQQSASTASSNSKPKDEPQSQFKQDESKEDRSTYSGQRPRWCDVLHLEPDASTAAIRKSYNRLMKGLHPDVAGADEDTSAQCALVQRAYDEAIQHARVRA